MRSPQTFLHSGGCGDIIYSLPFIKHLGGGVLYVKKWNEYHNFCDQYETLKPLLKAQPCIANLIPYPDGFKMFRHYGSIKIDVDLDKFRQYQHIRKDHLIQSYFKRFREDAVNWQKPFLKLPKTSMVIDKMKPKGRYVLINLTARNRDPAMDWGKLVKKLIAEYKGNVHFIGLTSEYLDFISHFRHVNYIQTDNFAQAAHLIKNSVGLYCNQSVCLTIAQGLGSRYFLEVAPGMTNCIMNKKNETILND